MQLRPLAQRQALHVLMLLLFEFRHVSRWRRHALAQHLFQHPYPALHRAGAVGERCGRKRGRHAEDATPVGIGQFNPTHLGPLHGLLQSVQLSQRLVQERVVAVHESHDALVLTQHALEKQAGLLHHRLP